jgi:hypothetical protein
MSTTATRGSVFARAGSSSTPQMRTAPAFPSGPAASSSAAGRSSSSSPSAVRSSVVNLRVSGDSDSGCISALSVAPTEVVGTAVTGGTGSFDVVVAMIRDRARARPLGSARRP